MSHDRAGGDDEMDVEITLLVVIIKIGLEISHA